MEAQRPPAGYRHRVAEVERRAVRVRAKLDAIAEEVTSPDGAVRVVVSPTGALQALTLGPRADELTRAALAATIISTTRLGQAQAARRAGELMQPLLGGDSAAMELLRSQLTSPTAQGCAR